MPRVMPAQARDFIGNDGGAATGAMRENSSEAEKSGGGYLIAPAVRPET